MEAGIFCGSLEVACPNLQSTLLLVADRSNVLQVLLQQSGWSNLVYHCMAQARHITAYITTYAQLCIIFVLTVLSRYPSNCMQVNFNDFNLMYRQCTLLCEAMQWMKLLSSPNSPLAILVELAELAAVPSWDSSIVASPRPHTASLESTLLTPYPFHFMRFLPS